MRLPTKRISILSRFLVGIICCQNRKIPNFAFESCVYIMTQSIFFQYVLLELLQLVLGTYYPYKELLYSCCFKQILRFLLEFFNPYERSSLFFYFFIFRIFLFKIAIIYQKFNDFLYLKHWPFLLKISSFLDLLEQSYSEVSLGICPYVSIPIFKQETGVDSKIHTNFQNIAFRAVLFLAKIEVKAQCVVSLPLNSFQKHFDDIIAFYDS